MRRIESADEHPPEKGEPGDDGPGGAMAAQSRTLRNSLISLAIFFALLAALLTGVPGLRSAARADHRCQPGLDRRRRSCWRCSPASASSSCSSSSSGCSGKRLASRLSLSELAVNSVVSVSGLAGIALGAWVLRSKGFSVERIAKRSVLIFVLTSAVNVARGDPHRPADVAGAAAGLAQPSADSGAGRSRAGDRRRSSRARRRGRAARPAAAGSRRVAWRSRWPRSSGGVLDALALIRSGDWRLLGGVGYWLFDNLVLYACLAAFGHAPSFWAVAMAYLVGMLANSVPVPGGFVAVEGGLVGMLLLFGVRPARWCSRPSSSTARYRCGFPR